MKEVSSILQTTVEKLLEMSSLKEKELHSQLQVLTVQRKTEKKEAWDLALKYNEVVLEHNKQINQVKSLQIHNDKLAKVLPCTILGFWICLSPFA